LLVMLHTFTIHVYLGHVHLTEQIALSHCRNVLFFQWNVLSNVVSLKYSTMDVFGQRLCETKKLAFSPTEKFFVKTFEILQN